MPSRIFRAVGSPDEAARWRGALRAVVEIAIPLLLAALAAFAFVKLTPSRGYKFRASSAYGGWPERSWTRINADSAFFHTKKTDRPWVEIVPDTPTFSRVRVWNRATNKNRAVPLILEIPDGKGGFKELGRKTEPFTETTFSFKRVRAPKIRLRVDKETYFHLQRVEVD